MSFNSALYGSGALGTQAAQSATSAQLLGSAIGSAIQSELAMMFGPQNASRTANYGEDVNRTHYDYYEAYSGSRLYLADTILGFVLMTPDFSMMVLPPLQTNQTTVKWNVYEFNTGLAQPTPYEGTSRLVSSKRHSHSASMSRYGLAFYMEGDLLGSPEGVEQYKRNTQMVSQACLETIHYHTMYEILACHDELKEKSDKLRQNGGRSKAIADWEASEFAALALDPLLFTIIADRHANAMRKERFDPEVMIVYPGFVWYTDVVATEVYTEFWQNGPLGSQVLVQGPVARGLFRNMPVFEAREFLQETIGGELPVQPLAQRVSVGEFYGMTFEAFRGTTLEKDYKTSWRDVAIYDIERDDYKRVSLVQALAHSRVFGGNLANEDALGPQTHELAAKINSAYRAGTGGLADDLRIYGNPALLENTGVSRPPRRHFMFLSHNTKKNAVEPVRKFAEFDIDVLPTSDLNQMVNSIRNRVFSLRGECDSETLCYIEDLFQFIDNAERIPYDDEFARDIVDENIDRSVNSEGEFVGTRTDSTQVRDLTPNAYGGLDLPLRRPDGGLLPPGQNSWNQILTYAEQAEARGYGTPQTNPNINLAKRGVLGVRKLLKALANIAGSSGALSLAAAPEWIHVNRAEAAVFNAMNVSRPPLWLGIPSDQKLNDPDVVAKTGVVELEEGPLIWNSLTPAAFGVGAAQSRPRLLSILRLSKTAEQLEQNLAQNVPSIFDQFRTIPLEQQKKFFPQYTSALWKFMNPATDDPIRIARTRKVLAELMDAAEKTATTAGADFSDATAAEILGSIAGQKTPGTVRDSDGSLAAFGERLIAVIQGQVVHRIAVGGSGGSNTFQPRVATTPNTSFRNSSGGGRPSNRLESKIGEWLGMQIHIKNDPASSTVHNVLLRSLNESFDTSAGLLANAVGVTLTGNNYAELEARAASAGSDVAPLLNTYNEDKVKLTSISAHLDKSLRTYLVGNEDPVGANPASGGPTYYARSPLGSSKVLIRSIATYKGPEAPLFLPSDPVSHNRRPFTSFEDEYAFSAVLQDPMVEEMSSASVKLGESRLLSQPLMRAKMARSEWKDPNPAGWRHNRAGLNDGFDVGLSVNKYGARIEDQLSISNRLDQHNSQRKARGLAPRSDIGFELARAEEKRAATERAMIDEEKRAETLRMFSEAALKSGLDQSGSHQSDPLSRALVGSTTYDMENDARPPGVSAALRELYPHATGAYAGATDNITSQYQLNRGNDLYLRQMAASAGKNDYITGDDGRVYRAVDTLPEECMQTDGDDNNEEVNNALGVSEEFTSAAHPNTVYRYRLLDKITDAVDRLITMVVLELPILSSVFVGLAANDIHVPINFILWRLHIEFEMWNIIMMRPGIDTGANLIGPSSMNFSNSAADKMFMGHFTFHNAPVIFNPRGVSIIRNVAPRAYQAGWDTTWLQSAEELRLPQRGSLIATPIAITENINKSRMSFTDITSPVPDVRLTNRPINSSIIPDHSSAAWAEITWGMTAKEIFGDTTAEGYFVTDLKVNERASEGKHFTYDKSRERHVSFHAGSSPLSGNRTGRGVAAIWCGGGTKRFPSQEAFDANPQVN